MKLHYRKLGEGEPLIILHGLYGSSDNWLNIGQVLSENFAVYILDQRNHGKSPNSDIHTYPSMRDDLLKFMNENNIQKANILGHSMGGKSAVYFATKYPERVKRLIVVDILPTPYALSDSDSPQILSHKNILQTLQGIDLKKIKTLKEAEDIMAKDIPYQRVRQFLLKNLKRDENKNFYWLINIKALIDHLPNIMDGIDTDNLSESEKIESFPVLFIKGEKSEHIGDNDKEKIQNLFPKAILTTIKGAGHWVHAEKRKEFIAVTKNFLKN